MNFNSNLPSTWVGATRTHTAQKRDILAELTNDITLERRQILVFTPNIQHIDLLRRDGEFRHAYSKARYVLPDGWPVALVASARSRRRVPRIAGSDFMLGVLAEAGARKWQIALVGGSQGSVVALRRRLVATGHDSRNVSIEPAPAEELADPVRRRALVERISTLQPQLVLLSLGAPQQELFAGNDLADADVGAVLCIGAGLDFAAGRRRRAPQLLQRVGLEWAWRLGLEPARLGPRYARAALGFILSLRQRPRRTDG